MTQWRNGPILPHFLYLLNLRYSLSLDRLLLDFALLPRDNPSVPDAGFQPGQMVRVNLAGIQVGNVLFQAAVTDAVGHIVRQTSDSPPKFLVKLLFSFRGVSEVDVPGDRIRLA